MVEPVNTDVPEQEAPEQEISEQSQADPYSGYHPMQDPLDYETPVEANKAPNNPTELKEEKIEDKPEKPEPKKETQPQKEEETEEEVPPEISDDYKFILGEGEEAKEVTLKDLKEQYQFVKNAEDYHTQAQTYMQQTETALQNLTTDPFTTMMNVMMHTKGVTKEEAYEQTIKAARAAVSYDDQYRGMSEEQKQALHSSWENERMRQELAEYKKREVEEKKATLEAQKTNEILSEITKAIKSIGKTPSPWMQSLAIEVMQRAVQSGRTLSWEDAVKRAIVQHEEITLANLKNADPEFIRKHRPDLIEAARKEDINKVKKELSKPQKAVKVEEEKKSRTKKRIGSNY